MRKNIYIVLKISACFFILLFTLSYYGCSIIPNLNSGTNDTIFFGNYKGENIEWIVLTTEGNKKLLLSSLCSLTARNGYEVIFQLQQH